MKIPSLLLLLVLPAAAVAQMRTGEQMSHYADTFGVVLNQRSYPYDVTLVAADPASNIVTPGQQPSYTFLFTNKGDQPLKASGKLDVLSYGTRGIPGDLWQSDLYKIADVSPIPIQVDLPAHGSQLVEVHPALPEAFGAYAFVADLGEAGRRFATSCVRTFAPAPEKIQYPKLSLDDLGSPVLQSLGVQAIRYGIGYTPTTSPAYAAEMAKLDAKLKEYASHNITVMLMLGAGSGDGIQPLGRGRPHLTPDGVMMNTKQDLAWLPSSDADFEKFVAALGRQYGWPKGPVTSMLLWNEPWEGISISGWGADSIRYRELFTAMAHGVEEARAGGAQILLAGCDSSTNTLDKLFGDGGDAFLKWLDVCTIHYQGLSAPVLWKKWLDRKGPNGRVRIWDTESWVANTADRIAAVIATDRAAGYDRAMGVFGGNIVTPLVRRGMGLPDGTKKDVETYTAWPPAAAVAAAQHFIGERDFKELLFKNGLPWVMLFDGAKGNADDGTAVVVGDIGAQFNPDMVLFRGVRGLAEAKEKEALRARLASLPADASERADVEKRLAAKTAVSGGSLTLENPKGEFVLYDFYGNPVPAGGKTITVPLDERGFFLRANGAPGSFGRLREALASARVEGYEPLDVIAHDLQAPVEARPVLRLTLTNVLNRPVSGKATLTLGGLTVDAPATLSFGPNETKEVSVPVTGGAARPDNTYPLAFRFDAGADGCALHQEDLHANVIARRTVQVDGDLSDWKGVLPEPVHAAGDQGPSLMEAAWLPFAKFDASRKAGFATGYLAADDKYFYFAAKIADNTPTPGTLRFEKRDDDAYFYPATSYEYDPDKTLLKKDEAWTAPSRAAAALLLPGSDKAGAGNRSTTMWTGIVGAFAVDVAVPEGAARKVTLYFVDPDEIGLGRRREAIEVHDAASGTILAQKEVAEFGPGNYLSFSVSGKVRIVVRSKSWTSPALSGIFIDPSSGGASSAPGASAALLGSDLQTGGAWAGKYGQDGYVIAGAAPKLPADVQVAFPDIEEKKVHAWPDGVRRYSYRKRPELPFGSAPKFDNVQIAFNVIPPGEKQAMALCPPGTMPGFIPSQDTDYEYALNQVAPEYGGGFEVWRSLVPGMVRKNFYPREPASPLDGTVKDAKLSVRWDGNTRIVEAALPWGEIPLVKAALDAGKPIKFSFRVNDDQGPGMELAQDRSVSRKTPYAFHPDWVEHWGNQVEFSLEKK